MYSKIEFVKVWPAGNLTALVVTQLPRSVYTEVATNILAKDRNIEQVGFVEPANNPRALARLQMMGGEFCGNATRSLAMFLYQELKRERGEAKTEFSLEVSGIDQLIQVKIINEKDVAIEIPVAHYDDRVFEEYRDGTLVKIDGIQHFITDMPDFARVNKDLLRIRASYILHQEGFIESSATGVIFVDKHEGKNAIYPFIWVKDMNTLIYESGCASGTLAASMKYAREIVEGLHIAEILQPSGLPLVATIQKIGGKFSKAVLSGGVEMRERCMEYFVVHDDTAPLFENRKFISAY